jgi:L-lactate dehydrogenase (cytochrome)
VGPDYPLLFDGTVSSGLDVLRAIALGADFVMLGRPWLWGVAAFGARGAAHVSHILTEDMTSGMIQMGITRPEEVRGRLWRGMTAPNP